MTALMTALMTSRLEDIQPGFWRYINILPACHFLISEFLLPYYILCTLCTLCTLCVLLYLVFFSSPTLLAHLFTYDSSHPQLLRMLFHTIPCLFHSSSPSFYVRFHSSSASSYAFPHHFLHLPLFPSIFYVRFLSSSASSYTFPHHSLPLPLFRPIFLRTIPLIICFFVRFPTPFSASPTLPVPLLRTIPLIHDFFVCPINFTPTFLILFSLIYLLKVLLFIFQ